MRTGNFAGSGPSTGRLHVEREQRALPFFAWPELGDRVTMIGSWVWDCGHWTPGGERTEIHSYRALWLERAPGRPSPLATRGESEGDLFLSSDKTYAGRRGRLCTPVEGRQPRVPELPGHRARLAGPERELPLSPARAAPAGRGLATASSEFSTPAARGERRERRRSCGQAAWT